MPTPTGTAATTPEQPEKRPDRGNVVGALWRVSGRLDERGGPTADDWADAVGTGQAAPTIEPFRAPAIAAGSAGWTTSVAGADRRNQPDTSLEGAFTMDTLTSATAEDQRFERFMAAVDNRLVELCGLGADGLPDYDYWVAFDDGRTPLATAKAAIRAADGGWF